MKNYQKRDDSLLAKYWLMSHNGGQPHLLTEKTCQELFDVDEMNSQVDTGEWYLESDEPVFYPPVHSLPEKFSFVNCETQELFEQTFRGFIDDMDNDDSYPIASQFHDAYEDLLLQCSFQ